MNILEIVSNKPSDEKRKDAVTCPYCSSYDISKYGTLSTCVGYVGVDYNHRWTKCYCNECERKFVRESKGPDSVWYVDEDKKVLKGIPTCFEHYIYQCIKCGGEVEREYIDTKTGKKAKSLSQGLNEKGEWVKLYRTEYRCKGCGHGGKVEDDYYKGEE